MIAATRTPTQQMPLGLEDLGYSPTLSPDEAAAAVAWAGVGLDARGARLWQGLGFAPVDIQKIKAYFATKPRYARIAARKGE